MSLSRQLNYAVQKQLAPGSAILVALSEDTTMKANVRLGRIWNIPIGLNSSWFLIFALSTWSLAMGFFPSAIPGLNAGSYWLLGALTSLHAQRLDVDIATVKSHVTRGWPSWACPRATKPPSGRGRWGLAGTQRWAGGRCPSAIVLLGINLCSIVPIRSDE